MKEKDEWPEGIPMDHLSIRIEEGNVIQINRQDMIEYNTFGNNIESPFYVYNAKTKEYVGRKNILRYRLRVHLCIEDCHAGHIINQVTIMTIANMADFISTSTGYYE